MKKIFSLVLIGLLAACTIEPTGRRARVAEVIGHSPDGVGPYVYVRLAVSDVKVLIDVKTLAVGDEVCEWHENARRYWLPCNG